jgi:hypothetical protein
MCAQFNKTSGISATGWALKAYEIEYKKQPCRRSLVPGNIQLNIRNLGELPDFADVIVQGNFECIANRLTSLKGAENGKQ